MSNLVDLFSRWYRDRDMQLLFSGCLLTAVFEYRCAVCLCPCSHVRSAPSVSDKEISKKLQDFKGNTAVSQWQKNVQKQGYQSNQFLLLTVLTGVTDLYGKPEA